MVKRFLEKKSEMRYKLDSRQKIMGGIIFIRRSDSNQALGICNTIISRQTLNVLILSVKCAPIFPLIVSERGRKLDKG